MKAFFIDLMHSDSFEGQPYAWATNQLSHFAIGLLLAWMIGPLAACAVVLAIEFVQWRRGGAWRDGIDDLWFWAIGITWAYSGGEWLLLLALTFTILVGITRRV